MSTWPRCFWCPAGAASAVAYCCADGHDIIVKFCCTRCCAGFLWCLQRGQYRCGCRAVFSDWVIRYQDETEEYGTSRGEDPPVR